MQYPDKNGSTLPGVRYHTFQWMTNDSREWVDVTLRYILFKNSQLQRRLLLLPLCSGGAVIYVLACEIRWYGFGVHLSERSDQPHWLSLDNKRDSRIRASHQGVSMMLSVFTGWASEKVHLTWVGVIHNNCYWVSTKFHSHLQRKSDAILWRIREIELSSQIAELRQHFSELDCLHDVENASNTLQSPPSRRNLDESLPLSSASSAAPTPAEVRRHPSTRVPPMTVGSERFSSMWKDLPPAIMTDSIGPLEDLCIIPDDPLITSIYVQESASKQVGEV